MTAFKSARLGTKVGEVQRATGLRSYQFGRGYTPPSRNQNVEQVVKDSYERITWVFRAVNARANNSARLPVDVRRGDPTEGQLIPDHPLLPILNYMAHPTTNEQAFLFRHRVSSQLDLSTRGVFIEKVFANDGSVVGLSLLPPQFTKPIPDPVTFVSGYEVKVGEANWTIPAANVIWLRNPHPLDPYRSMTPAEAAGLAIDTDWLSHLYNARFIRNDGRPGGIIAVKGDMEDDDADELKSYFSDGVDRAGEWRVITGDELTGIDVEDMATTPRDAQYVEMRSLSKDEILVAYGTPESVLGNASDRTFANADAERDMFWIETMPPHLELIGGGFDLVDKDPTTFVSFDVSGVDVVQKIEAARRASLLTEWQEGLITIDEYREATGRNKFNVRDTRRLWISMALTPIDVARADIAAAALEAENAPTPPPPPDPNAPPADAPPENVVPLRGAASKGRGSPFGRRMATR